MGSVPDWISALAAFIAALGAWRAKRGVDTLTLAVAAVARAEAKVDVTVNTTASERGPAVVTLAGDLNVKKPDLTLQAAVPDEESLRDE